MEADPPRALTNPPAEVYLDDEQWQFVLRDCPHCGEEHRHGAGHRGEDPRKALGHRVAHCDPRAIPDAWARGYYLVLPIEMTA